MSFLSFLSGGGSAPFDMAIDLGTANTLIALSGEGIVLNEPSVVALEKGSKRLVAAGHEAKEMLEGGSGNVTVEYPLHYGVIADYEVACAMLSAFMAKAAPRSAPWQPKPRVVVCVPCGAAPVDKRMVFDATMRAGAKQVFLVEEPMAAALGADLPVSSATASMVMDIGGGTTEIAVISQGGIVSSTSLRLAGNRMDEIISQYLHNLLGVHIGGRTAEVIKIKIGSVLPFTDRRERDMAINCQDIATGKPTEATVRSEDVRAALRPAADKLALHVGEALKKASPDQASDIVRNGILLTGGGGLLSGLAEYLTYQLEIPVWASETALTDVVVGCLRVLETPEALKQTISRSR